MTHGANSTKRGPGLRAENHKASQREIQNVLNTRRDAPCLQIGGVRAAKAATPSDRYRISAVSIRALAFLRRRQADPETRVDMREPRITKAVLQEKPDDLQGLISKLATKR